MRKFAYIFLGLALMIGAGGFFYQRHLSPEQIPWWSLQVDPRLSQDYFDGTRSARPAPAPKPQKRALLDRALDVLNLIVGVAGIWFSISGVRMQRAAAKVMAMRDGDQ